MYTKFYKKTFNWLVVIFLIAILVKIAQQTILPEKYFYDSYKILKIMNCGLIADKTYMVTAKIFNFINIFRLNELSEWSILFGVIFNILFFLILLFRNKSYKTSQYIFIYTSIVLLNIYVFNLSKDIIQFCIFLIIYKIIIDKNKNNMKKLIYIAIILLIEAITYRVYYGIMAMILLSIYFIYIIFIDNKKLNKKSIMKIVLFSIGIFFIEVYIVSILSNDNYNAILNARSSVNIYRDNDVDAVTIIKDVLGPNTNFIKFTGNYIINFIRMAVPIELIAKGVKYIPFIIYQVYITLIFIRSAKKISQKNILLIETFLAFFMVSVIFEPDFGSFIRHESAISLIIIEMTQEKNYNELLEDSNIETKKQY